MPTLPAAIVGSDSDRSHPGPDGSGRDLVGDGAARAGAAHRDGAHLAELLDGDKDQGGQQAHGRVPECILVHWEGSGAGAIASLRGLGWEVWEHDLAAVGKGGSCARSGPGGRGAPPCAPDQPQPLTVLRHGLPGVVLCGVAVPAKKFTLTLHKLLAGALSEGDVVALGRPILPRTYRLIEPSYRAAGISLVATLCGARRSILAGADAQPQDILSWTMTLACALAPREAWPSELEDFMGEARFPRFRDTVAMESLQ